MPEPISLDEFSEILSRRYGALLAEQSDVAVGVSGGPDSMALVKLLSDWAAANDGPQIHALIVDHGLRAESAQEAAQVVERLAGWGRVHVEILTCDDLSTESCAMENARKGRYEVMERYCTKWAGRKGGTIKHLFLAHHQDDQAETFLFRLAKGSGLDGLAAMKDEQARGALTLLRPLLDIPKVRLVATCEAHSVEYLRDPSNESERFARVRLRQSMDVLEQEGLSVKRLATTAARLARARQALEQITEDAGKYIIIKKDTSRIVLDYKLLSGQPAEIALRIVLQGFEHLRPDADYAPRMEKIEALFENLMSAAPFRKRTLGGLVFERDDKAGQVLLQIEESAQAHI